MREGGVERPNFLSDNIEITNPNFAEGGFLKVADLSSVSPEAAEQVPNDFLLKQYKYDEFSHEWASNVFTDDKVINLSNRRVPAAYLKVKSHRAPGEESKEPTIDEIIRKINEDYNEAQESFDIRKKRGLLLPNEEKEHEEYMRERQIFSDPDYVIKTLKAFSYQGIAKRLKERNDLLQEYFGRTQLKNLILPTQFIIGAEKSKAKNEAGIPGDGKKHIYEIQEEVESLQFPDDVINDARLTYLGQYFGFGGNYIESSEIQFLMDSGTTEMADYLRKTLSPEQLANFMEQINTLIDSAKKLPGKTGTVPIDILVPGNLLITPQGDLKIIDTNFSSPLTKERVPPSSKEVLHPYFTNVELCKRAYLQAYKRMISYWDNVRDKLKK